MTVRNILEKIPDILLAQLAAFSLVYGLTSSLLLTFPPLNILLIVMLCVILLFGFFYNRTSAIAASVLLGVTFLAAVIYIIFGVGIPKVISFFDGYFYWLGDFIQYADTPSAGYQLITVITLSLLMSVFTYIFVVKKFMFLVIAIFGIGMFAVQWSYGITSSMAPFYIYLFVTLISYLRHIYAMKTFVAANEYSKPSTMIIWSVPVCLIIIALAAAFHASEKPIEWKWLDKKIVSVYNYFSRNLDYEAFDYFSLASSSGFGDRNNLLGGRVRLDKTNVLKVITTRNVYLKGVVQDVYTGTRWIDSSSARTALGGNYGSMYEDTDEMLEGMKILTGKQDFLKDYLYKNEISISFLNLKTKSLFLPDKAAVFKPKRSLPVFADSTGGISTSQRLTKGFTYNVDMYTPAIGTEEFADVMRRSKRGLYREYLLKADFPDYFSAVGENGLNQAGFFAVAPTGSAILSQIQIGTLGGLDISTVTTNSAVSTSSALTSSSSVIKNSAVSAAHAVTSSSSVITNSAASTASAIHAIISATSTGSSVTTYGGIFITSITAATGSAVTTTGSAAAIIDPEKEQAEKYQTYQKIKYYKEESEKIYNTYLQLPDNLPQRVKDLAASLVANSSTDYDKAKAIEQYLSRNYPYNLDVRSTPRNRDFVDYFLFDLKQGYCAYYASAMAVLARCVGLPARYVEGYMLPPEPVKGNTSTYIITNMQAHAWVEIYFEGYGWLPFEPTSPFSANFYSSKQTEAVFSSSYNSAYEDYMELMKRYSRNHDMEDLTNIVVQQEKTPAFVYILITIAALILLIGSVLLFNVSRNRFRLYRITNLPAKDCILRFYDYYVAVLTLIGLGLVPAETPVQYSGRIDTSMFFSPVRFKVITEIFIKARYSLKDVSEKEKLLFCDFHQGFLDEVKINMGKSKYFINKYILGRF